MLTIYHNPRCRKSREALEIMEKAGKKFEVVYYLDNTPSVAELTEVVEKLGGEAFDLVRKEEQIFKDEYRGKEFSNEEWIEIMIANPILIQRPVVFDDKKAVIGRPPEDVKELL